MNKVIGVDIDGVIANTVKAAIADTDLTYEDIDRWDFERDDFRIGSVINRMHAKNPFAIRPYPDALELLEHLRSKHSVTLVTARNKHTDNLTRDWLDYHGLPYDLLLHVPTGKKWMAPIDILIDDYAFNVNEFKRVTNKGAIIITRPWNRNDTLRRGVLRADGVVTALSAVNLIESLDDV